MPQTPDVPPTDPQVTLARLSDAMRQRGDLPGFSRAVSAILTAMRGDDGCAFNLTRTVLSDPALTQKVLRLANSPMYAVFGKEINTVTKAIAVLGTESIGHLALGLKLIDGLAVASTDSQAARSEMEKAVLSGHIGRHVAALASSRDAEEAVVCAMLHGLGRILVSFYLPEQWQLMQAEMRQHGAEEFTAALAQLGMGLDQIGRHVAQQWGLPSGLVGTLKDVPATVLMEPLDHNGWLATVATMSMQSADAAIDPGAECDVTLARIANTYADMLGIAPMQLLGAVQTAQKIARDEATAPVSQALPKGGEGSEGKVVRQTSTLSGKPADAAQRLARGVSELTSLEQNASASQALSIALEVMYQSLGCTRGAVFQRLSKEYRYLAYMFLSQDTRSSRDQLTFSDAYQPDVFHAALAKDTMVFVENAQAPSFNNKLPRWWKNAVPGAIGLLVIPLTVDRQPVGFLYADWDGDNVPAKIEPAEIAALNAIRTLLNVLLTRDCWPASHWNRAKP